MNKRIRHRLIAAFGFIWISGIVGFLVFGTDSAFLWKLAWAEYGLIGLVDMAGIWRGRDEDEGWNRRMRRVQLAGFVVAAGLFLGGALWSN